MPTLGHEALSSIPLGAEADAGSPLLFGLISLAPISALPSGGAGGGGGAPPAAVRVRGLRRISSPPEFAPYPLNPGETIRQKHPKFDPLNVSVVTSITFGQTVVASGVKRVEVTTDITFGQAVARLMEYSRSLETEVDFGGFANTNIKPIDAETEVTFGQTVQRNLEYNRGVETQVYFNAQGKRTIVASVTTAITFGQQSSRGEAVETQVQFDQTVVTDKSRAAASSIQFAQTVQPNIDRGLAGSTAIVFSQLALAWIDDKCDLQEYMPIGSLDPVTQGVRAFITFTKDAFTIDLRNPEFGNALTPDNRRAVNESRGGTTQLCRRSSWAREVELRMSFLNLTRAEATAFLTFIDNTLGEELTFTDQETQTWLGVLTSVSEPIIDETRRPSDCRYRVDVVFMGNRT